MDLSKIVNKPTATPVDVRESYEFQANHVPGAIHIPLNSIFHRIEEFQQMTKPIILYCRSGNRSEHAKLLLQAKGVREVYNAGSVGDVLHYQSLALKHAVA